MFLSIILPTYNEEENISKTISHLHQNLFPNSYEIIVSDAESTDNTALFAQNLGAIVLNSPIKGRAGQMNNGVKHAQGDVYYFVHADCLPHPTFQKEIQIAIQSGYDCGSFITQFDSNRFILKINAFFTRFNYLFFRGGDQSIFITKKLWLEVGTYKDEMLIMEDYDFLKRVWKSGKFKLIRKATLISARKYDQNSWLTVQLANLKVVRMYKNGASQQAMVSTYKQMLNYRKNAF